MTVYRDPSWGWPTKMGLIAIALGVLWFSLPSSIFLRPINMTVIKSPQGRWIMVSEQETPFGAQTAHVQAVIQVLGRKDGQECQHSNDALFIPKSDNISRYDISSWAAPCLDAGPPISVRFTRTVYLIDLIPLRPVHYSFTINPETAPVVDTSGMN